MSRLYLIGYRCTGKTTVGPLLAARLGYDFIDADAELERHAGMTIREIFASEGEVGFRDREQAMLRELSGRDRCVIASGGGIVLRAANRERLRATGFVAWLMASPGSIWQRMQDDPITAARRPALAQGGLAEVEQLLQVREPFYRETADVAIDTEGLSPEAIADAILGRMADDYILIAKIAWLSLLFLFGAAVGSFLNVCIARLPLEKSVLWPGSRCGSCLQPIRGRDNIPILSYLFLRGRCRTCGAGFSSRYMWVELLTGLAWAGIFYFEILSNGLQVPYLRQHQWDIQHGVVPFKAWVFYFHHVILLSFLIVAALCDLDHRIIPLTVTFPGTMLGLLSATLHPWPWPNEPQSVEKISRLSTWSELGRAPVDIVPGLYPCPVWGPPPEALPAGSWQLGLATGLVGALVGTLMLRAVKYLAEKGLGKEALGVGDADLMMMVGAFLGWQLVVVGFFVGALAALVLAIAGMIMLRGQEGHIPFGPGLAAGAVITWLTWPRIGRPFQEFLFSGVIVIVLVAFFGIGMLGLTFLIRKGFYNEEELRAGKR